MKKLINNKKGFTLIELLAVIVILAILVMVAIPAVTKYLNTSRNSAFVDNAKSAVSAVRNDYIISNGAGGEKCTVDGKEVICYTKSKINDLLEKKLVSSPFGGSYKDACVVVEDANNSSSTNVTDAKKVEYKVCLIDAKGNGFELTNENGNNNEGLSVGTGISDMCGCTIASS